jgi:Type II CAAX prenyl endopeptidase Rce1-like
MRDEMKTAFALAGLGILGVASLGLVPLETVLPLEAGHVPRVALLIQPLVLTVAAAFLGGWAASKVGLSAPLIEALVTCKPALGRFNHLVTPAIIGAVAVAVVLLLYGAWSEAVFPVGPDGKVRPLQNLPVPLLSKLLYGGLSEEILSRWGLMSLLAFGALKLGMQRAGALWVGNGVAALLFALGHIPFLLLLMPSPTAAIVVAVLIGNMIPGLIFGWLFQRCGIEAAMIAHAGGHFLATVVS